MLTDQKGNVIKPGTKLVVIMANPTVEVEVIAVHEGGMTLAVDKKTGQQVISMTEVDCKMTFNAAPGQPLAGSWVVVVPQAAKAGN